MAAPRLTPQEQIQEQARKAYIAARVREALQVTFPEYDILPKGTAERLERAEEAEAELAMIAAVLQKYHLACGRPT